MMTDRLVIIPQHAAGIVANGIHDRPITAGHQAGAHRVAALTILVVEDEVAIQELVRLNLQLAGFDALAAHSAEQALLMLNEVRPDLILLDWLLPGMSGLEFARRLRNSPPIRHLPLIMLTARSDLQDKLASLAAGADDYLCKPFSPRELIARIQAVLRKRAGDQTQFIS